MDDDNDSSDVGNVADDSSRTGATGELGDLNHVINELVSPRDARTPPPPFPVHVLPGAMREFAETTAASMPCPVDFIGAGMLAAFGQALGTNCRLHVRSRWDELAVSFVALVARPGDVKSPALRRTMLPVEIAEANARTQFAEDMAKWEIASAGDETDELVRPSLRRHLVSDVTMEQLAQLMNANPEGAGLLLHRDELAGWVKSMNVYRGGRGADQQNYLSIWSGETLISDRKTTADAYVREPFLCVIGGVQPDALPDLSTDREDGFVDRVLFAYPDPVVPRWVDDGGHEVLDLKYVSTHRALLDLPRKTVTFTPEGRDVWASWYDRWSEYLSGWDGPGRGARAKMHRYCARFALILSQVRLVTTGELPDAVTAEDVVGAIELVNYFTHMADRALGRLTVSPTNVRGGGVPHEKVRRGILQRLAKNDGVMTQRDLCRSKPGGCSKCDDIAAVAKDLENAGLVTTSRTEKPGRMESVVITLTREGWTEANAL